jgi:hypothetical protein
MGAALSVAIFANAKEAGLLNIRETKLEFPPVRPLLMAPVAWYPMICNDGSNLSLGGVSLRTVGVLTGEGVTDGGYHRIPKHLPSPWKCKNNSNDRQY